MTNKPIKFTILGIISLSFIGYILSVWWSIQPDIIVPNKDKRVVGYATTESIIKTMETLLTKPGGWTYNDFMPPSLLMDDMPSFEHGALEQVRDITFAMRNDFSRSQSQSTTDSDLTKANSKFNISPESWMFPSAEDEYRGGIKALQHYLNRMEDPKKADAQFYTRADNLNDWLKMVQKRLGSMSQRLSASTGQMRLNTDLGLDSAAAQSTPTKGDTLIKTSWFYIDNVFYEARGTNWALLNFMKAIEIDFADVLAKKNATVNFQQIIRELEESEQTVWSPIILNGSGFGIVANHSLVMANYISRANAALIDLTNLLNQG